MHRTRPFSWRLLQNLCVGLIFSVLALDVDAATFLVTKETDDDGACEIDDCALREAILAANATPGMDTVVLPGGIYQLSIPGPAENYCLTGDLDILDDLEILGDEEGTTVIVGDGSDRVIQMGLSSVMISNVTVTGGVAIPSGGGLRVDVGNLTIIDSTIRNNSTTEDGGGVFVTIGNLIVINTTISDNSAGGNGFGGGIYTFGISNNLANLTLINSTVSGNSAFSGGGVFNLGDTDAKFTNSTFAANTASFRGDAFANQASGRPTFTNTLIVGECAILSSIPISFGGNIESPGKTCYLPHPTDRNSVPNPGIGPLADNGGPTWTHALFASSPAVDTAIDGQCPATDQRGQGRPVDGDRDGVATCDVGAYELTLPPLEVPALSPVGLAGFALLLAGAALAGLRRIARA